MNRSILSFLCTCKRRLNVFTQPASMTDWSRLFQLLITLSEKKYSRTSLLVQCLVNFRVWPLVLSCFVNWKSDSNGGRDVRAPCTSWRGRLDLPDFVFLPTYSYGESVTLLHNSCLWIQESSWRIFAGSSLWAVCPWYNEVTMLPYNTQYEDAPWTCTVLTWHMDSCTECSFQSFPILY